MFFWLIDIAQTSWLKLFFNTDYCIKKSYNEQKQI